MQACQNHGEVYVTASVRNSSQWETSTGARGERERGPDGNGKSPLPIVGH